MATYGKNSCVGKLLEIQQEDPGRVHVVLIRPQMNELGWRAARPSWRQGFAAA
jgi:hypothetical protein